MSFSKVPSTRHYAIITEVNVTIPGDERSRTHPGHGYPEETRTYTQYEAFTDKEKWLNKIKGYENERYGRTSYRAMEVIPIKIEKTVTLKAIE